MMISCQNHSILILLLAFVLQNCAPAPVYHSQNKTSKNSAASSSEFKNESSEVFKGVASYYADKFNGRKTASGEVFDQKLLTAAHRTWPFETVVSVTNLANGKSVQVRINDRGPFVKDRLIDLSRAAAQKIDMLRSGTANVEISIIRWGRE